MRYYVVWCFVMCCDGFNGNSEERAVVLTMSESVADETYSKNVIVWLCSHSRRAIGH